ncbi:FAD-dependent monooxygenase [Bauldia sp.]|uniref:FAD-dependent monooxygenase n=1 Tax=Bauldia sp. TaxID=2575872 RepID=UPI003BAC6FDA
MGERPTFLIIGAGIAGLTTALAIARAGFDAVIAERAEALSEIGAGIQLSPNAGRVLADLGLDDAIATLALEPRLIDIRDGASGAVLTALPVEAFRQRYGFPYRVIHRADLQKVLADAVKAAHGVTLILGAVLDDVLARDDTLFAKLKGHRGEVMEVAGIIGADGVWSTTRDRVPGARGPVPTGRTAWRTVIPVDNAPASLPTDRVGLWLGPNAHLVHYPIAGGAAVNVVAIIAERWAKPGWNARGDYRLIAERLNGWSPEVRAILAAAATWQRWALNAVDPTGPWSSGATTLIGDAAHAMVPFLAQGAVMAIEDAAVLGDCLAATGGNAEPAFRAYEAQRRQRVTKVWNVANRTGEHYHAEGLTARVRDLALRAAGTRLILMQNDWIYRWRPNGATGETG